jgi:hypothetical protein
VAGGMTIENLQDSDKIDHVNELINMKEIAKKYTNGEVTVVYQPAK